jgi:hypothetical protein
MLGLLEAVLPITANGVIATEAVDCYLIASGSSKPQNTEAFT